ncbi:MAG: hypothetical protein ACE14P_04805 [Methanotrichaceae archaeon]
MTYNEAADLVESLPGLDGIGFVIPKGYAIIGLAKCYDESDILNHIASRQVYKFRSYTERSISGKGLHIIVKANLNGYYKNTFFVDGQSVDVLTPGNFVTYTGNNIDDEVYWIDESTVIIQIMYDIYKKEKGDFGQEKNADYSFGELHDCPYGKIVLRNECDNIRRATIGNRTNTLLKAAFTMGGLISDGHISENEAFDELNAAGRATGLSYVKVRRAIEDGSKYGKLHPRDAKCGDIIHSYR